MPRRIASHVAAELVDERIVEQHRVITVRRVEYPIGVGRETEQWKSPFLVEVIDELHGEALTEGVPKFGASDLAGGF